MDHRIVFPLLIMFAVVACARTNSVEVTETAKADSSSSIVIRIPENETETCFVNKKIVRLEDLTDYLEQRHTRDGEAQIIIEAHKESRMERVVEGMDAAVQAGYEKVDLRTLE